MGKEMIQKYDPEIYELLCQEEYRQENTLDMIASESLQDEVTLALSGSAFCNKTAVGLPGKQRLGGSHVADRLEKLAAQRACELFGAEHANMLPCSGTTANLCVYHAILRPGDTVLALDPEQISHASHGRKEHISASLYRFVHSGLNPDTLLIDYDGLYALLRQYRPKLLVVGVSAYSRQIDYGRIAEMSHEHGCVFMVDMAHFSGLVAAGMAPNPVAYADIVTASATKTMCSCHTGFILCRKEYAQAVDAGVYPGLMASNHLQTIAAAAWALKRASSSEFRQVMQQTVRNAQALSQALMQRGFGILNGGTDCHMLMVDLRPVYGKYPDGPKDAAEFCVRLENIGISVNSKRIPFDQADKVSGLRVGCTILSQRGMKEADMDDVAGLFLAALRTDKESVECAQEKVREMCRRFRPATLCSE